MAGTRRDVELVGRDEELAAVRSALAAGGAVVAGAPGVGKSRLAAEAVAGAAGPVLRVIATESAATIPFGAFAHALPVDVAPSIPAVVQHVRALGGATVLVDDGHLLDDASAAVLLAIVTSGAASVLVTLRAHEPAPDAVTALWKDHGVERIEVQELGRRDLRTLLGLLLDAPVHATAADRILHLCRGNPLYVRELVLEARRTGALHVVAGRWHWHEDVLELDRLATLVERRVREVSTEARVALELLAVGAPLPLSVVCELAGTDAVEELERLELARVVDRAGEAELDTAHPLHREVVAARLPASTAARLRRALAGAIAPRSDDDLLRMMVWRADAGDRGDVAFIDASGLALRRGAAGLALRLAEAGGPSTVRGAIAAAAALNALNRFDDAEDVLAPFEHEVSTADAAAAIEYLEARFRGLLRSSRGLDDARALLDRVAGWQSGRDWEALLAAQHAWVELYAARASGALAIVEPLVDDLTISPGRRFALLGIACMARLRRGLVDDAIDGMRRVTAVAAEMGTSPWELRFLQVTIESMALTEAARDLDAVGEAVELLRDGAERDGDRALVACTLWCEGSIALRRGHAADACRLLGAAADIFAESDPGNSRTGLLTWRARAEGMAGDEVAAAATVDEIVASVAAHPQVASRVDGELEIARAAAEAAAGRTSDAIDRLLAIADAEADCPPNVLEVLYDAMRLGADPRPIAPRLEALDAVVQHDVGGLYARHAYALVAGDAPALESVSADLAAIGLDLYAAEAVAAAARLHRTAGRRDAFRRASATASALAERCVGSAAAARLRSGDPELPALTRRELEIASLAARGLSNREIADALVVSVRTVESYVLRACRKLGVDSRQDLAALLGA